jgi:hypothetical protein
MGSVCASSAEGERNGAVSVSAIGSGLFKQSFSKGAVKNDSSRLPGCHQSRHARSAGHRRQLLERAGAPCWCEAPFLAGGRSRGRSALLARISLWSRSGACGARNVVPGASLCAPPSSRRTSAGRHGGAHPNLKSNLAPRRVSRLYLSTGLARWFKKVKPVRSAGAKASATPGRAQ